MYRQANPNLGRCPISFTEIGDLVAYQLKALILEHVKRVLRIELKCVGRSYTRIDYGELENIVKIIQIRDRHCFFVMREMKYLS